MLLKIISSVIWFFSYNDCSSVLCQISIGFFLIYVRFESKFVVPWQRTLLIELNKIHDYRRLYLNMTITNTEYGTKTWEP